jgi:hypothetical protein
MSIIKFLKENNINHYIKNINNIELELSQLKYNKSIINNWLQNINSTNEILIINGNLCLENIKEIPNWLIDMYTQYTCIINSYLDPCYLKTVPNNFLKNCIINQGVNLNSLEVVPENLLDNTIIGGLNLFHLKSIPQNFLNNCTINYRLMLQNIKYLPKGFSPNVKDEIYLDSLKSKTLRNLILYPGVKRQLGFNLLKI